MRSFSSRLSQAIQACAQEALATQEAIPDDLDSTVMIKELDPAVAQETVDAAILEQMLAVLLVFAVRNEMQSIVFDYCNGRMQAVKQTNHFELFPLPVFYQTDLMRLLMRETNATFDRSVTLDLQQGRIEISHELGKSALPVFRLSGLDQLVISAKAPNQQQ